MAARTKTAKKSTKVSKTIKTELVVLTKDEKSEFRRCQSIIRKGMGTFLEVGEALMTIQTNNLYRESHSTFEAFCRAEFEMGRAHAYRLIDSAKVIHDLAPLKEQDFPLPTNEGQIRVLASMPSEERVSAWEKVLSASKAQEKPITAKLIQTVVNPKTERPKGTTRTSSKAPRLTRGRVLEFVTELQKLLDEGKATEAKALLEGFKKGI